MKLRTASEWEQYFTTRRYRFKKWLKEALSNNNGSDSAAGTDAKEPTK